MKSNVILNLLFPPRCLLCKAEMAEQGICAQCFPELEFITSPQCSCCGFPFSGVEDGPYQCASCLEKPPSFSKMRSAAIYNDQAATLISRFKYQDKLHLAPFLHRIIERIVPELIQSVDLVIPVPLHRFKLWARSYNQAALLARHIAKQHQLVYDPHTLIRPRYGRVQAGLTKTQRKANARRNFIVNHKRKERIKDKKILLIDDVYTTGATIEACSKALKRAGASDVVVLTLARVL